jgi:signal transduction histidine kinase
MAGGGMAGMMSGAGGMMDPVIRTAFDDAVGMAILLGIGAAIAAAAVAAGVLSGWIARPVSDLASATARIARGDYSGRVPAAQGEIGELAASFNDMAAALEATEQRRRDLIGDVAHELRTPIASVRGYVAGLEAGIFSPGPDAWRVLDEQTDRLARLVDDLALLWQADSHDLRLDLETLDAASLLLDARERHRKFAAERGIALTAEQLTPLAVRADRVRVAQVLDTLVGNALRYTPVGGSVALVVDVDGPMVALSVADDGPGLTAAQAAHVFDRFYRTDASRSRDAGGSGLGLAISRSLAEAMGGSIVTASPGLGLGTTFTVLLPRG